MSLLVMHLQESYMGFSKNPLLDL